MDGYGTEGASAYAQHYEIVEVITDILRLDVYGLNYFVLVEGQLSPLHASALFIHALCRRLICRRICLELLRGYAALDEAAHHIVEIHTKSHFLFKGLTSKVLHKNTSICKNIIAYKYNKFILIITHNCRTRA